MLILENRGKFGVKKIINSRLISPPIFFKYTSKLLQEAYYSITILLPTFCI